MGILVTYKFEDMTAQDVVLLGQGLDFMPHGRVRALVDKLQAQITAQDTGHPAAAADAVDGSAAAAAMEADQVKRRAQLREMITDRLYNCSRDVVNCRAVAGDAADELVAELKAHGYVKE